MTEYEQIGTRHIGVFHLTRWRPRPPVSDWCVGETQSGRRVHIIGDPYLDERSSVTIDDHVAKILNIERYRDGGTTRIYTNRGLVYSPINYVDGRRFFTYYLDGEEIVATTKEGD